MAEIIDLDDYGQDITDPRYKRLGATDHSDVGMYVRFSPGFGLNVHIGIRRHKTTGGLPHSTEEDLMVISGAGWKRLCELADEWRTREAEHGHP